MATYFLPADATHKKLLPEAYRDVNELADVAAQAEADVIRRYTGREYVAEATALGTTPERYVYLDGYKVDSAAAPSHLAEALRYTIALVIGWRIAQLKKNPIIDIQFAGGTSNNFRPDAADPFPPRWHWRLTEYDLRPDAVVWGT